MDSLFLDTSFIIALEDADDQNHPPAVAYWKSFKRNPRKIIITSYIFDETVTFLKRRISHEKAAEVGNLMLSSPTVELIHISEEHFDKGWRLFLKYHDKCFSFTDCISFLVMEENGIKKALTFDEHFRQMGINIEPS